MPFFKRLGATLVFFFLACFLAKAQIAPGGQSWPFTIGAGSNQIPAATTVVAGSIRGISDGATSNDCTIGGGSYAVVCIDWGMIWLPITGSSGGGGGGTPLFVNGVSNSSQSALNLENSLAAWNGVSVVVSNPSSTNVAFGLTGSLTNAGLQHSSILFTVPSWLTGTSSVSLGGTFALAAATGQSPHQVIGTCGAATSFAPCFLGLSDLPTGYSYANLSGAPTIYYQLLGVNGTSQTARNRANFIGAGSVVVTVADNSGTGSTDVTITGTGGGGAGATITNIPNASSTGTTLNSLAKIVNGNAVITATTDTKGAEGVVSAGAGTIGDPTIATIGTVTCNFDGATVQNHFVQISPTIAGDCDDAGATPPVGIQVLGIVLSTNGSGGAYSMVWFPQSQPPYIPGTGEVCTSGAGGYTCNPDPNVYTSRLFDQEGINRSVIATGASTGTLLCTGNPTFVNYYQNQTLSIIIADGASHGSDTINCDGVGPKPLMKLVSGSLTAIAANDMVMGTPYLMRAYGSSPYGTGPVTGFIILLDGSGGGGGMVYPASGIPCSTGSAWCGSYGTSGTGNVMLNSAPQVNALSMGAGSSGLTETWVVGASSVIQYTLVQTDSSNPSKIIPATSGAYGIAMSGQSPSSNVEVARYGTVNCITDTGGATAGDLVILGTGTTYYCKDSGVASSSNIPIQTRIIGIFRSTVSGGSTALVELLPGHYGTQLTPGTANLTAQTGSIGTATVASSLSGQYTFSYYANQNGLCASSLDLVSFTFNWTDSGNSRSLTTTPLQLTTSQATTGNYISGIMSIWVTSGSFTYSSTLTGSCSGASYDVHVAVTRVQ